MVVDLNDVTPFFTWLLQTALWQWLLVVACVVVGATAVGWLVAAVRHGPRSATRLTGQVLEQRRGRSGPHLAAARRGAGLAWR